MVVRSHHADSGVGWTWISVPASSPIKCVISSKALGYKHGLHVSNESFSLFCMINCPQMKGFYYNHYEELGLSRMRSGGGPCARLSRLCLKYSSPCLQCAAERSSNARTGKCPLALVT